MAHRRGLLALPAELQVHIATYLSSGVKHAGSSKDLLNLALTCRQLAPIVREVLCTAPVLQSSKVHLLLDFLCMYPHLAKTIKTLTVETKETRKDGTYPVPIPLLQSDVLDHCRQHVRTLPVRKWTQDTMIASLKATRFADHGLLLSLLLTTLPRLEQLYLGGSILLNFPILRDLIPNEPEAPAGPTWAEGPDMSWVVAVIGHQLTALELPIDFRRTLEDNIWRPLSISRIPDFFPNLRWLSIPHTAATETSSSEVVPRSLETLILTDARGNCFEQFASELIEDGKALFPRLSKIALYHRYLGAPTDDAVIKALADIDIGVFEYIPDCCLRSGDEFYHPWKYTPAEIDALSEVRHAGYATEWDRRIAM
ncbi:hypothetical protein EKO04_005690 [Ascochyta lentis]|uniref:F-box domain-containing protein n=1 Tax=Ascochyta lentis TaxID=205686 RepID=A0A8H7J6K5_9PLEO|nr:hypothetical protein EKO04_005690 [Ascochyta lentis]